MINGELLMKVLIAEFILIAVVYGLEKNFAKSLYFVAAAVLNYAVLVM